MDKDDETKAWRLAYKESCQEHIPEGTTNFQNVFTPYDLCYDMIRKLETYLGGFKDKTFCVFNLEFAEVLCYIFGIDREKVWFVTDCEYKRKFAEAERYNGINVKLTEFGSFLKENWDMKFDVVIGNPPYQKPTAGGNGQRDLWPDFVERGLELTKKGGYLCLIHPAKWRRTENKLWKKLSEKQIKYLEIHSDTDGRKVFNAVTRYDWYVLQNAPCKKKSVVKDENGNIHEMDLNSLPCLPNYHFAEFYELLDSHGEANSDILYSRTLHGNDKPNMSKEKDDNFQYPCVYGMYQDGTFSCFYSSTKSEHFVPKVIMGTGRYLYPVIDMKGEYGMTQNAFGIKVRSLKEATIIKKAIESEKFREIIRATKWGNFQTDWRMFKYFKKDFWRNFV